MRDARGELIDVAIPRHIPLFQRRLMRERLYCQGFHRRGAAELIECCHAYLLLSCAAGTYDVDELLLPAY